MDFGGQRVIMGIDPGTQIMGYGVILVDGKKVHFVDLGIIDLRKEKDHFAKLERIFINIIRHTNFSNIMQKSHHINVILFRFAQPCPASNHFRIISHAR